MFLDGAGKGAYANALEMERSFLLSINDDVQRWYDEWLFNYVTGLVRGDATDSDLG